MKKARKLPARIKSKDIMRSTYKRLLDIYLTPPVLRFLSKREAIFKIHITSPIQIKKEKPPYERAVSPFSPCPFNTILTFYNYLVN